MKDNGTIIAIMGGVIIGVLLLYVAELATQTKPPTNKVVNIYDIGWESPDFVPTPATIFERRF